MSQCVPNWDLDENPAPPRHSGSSNPSYEVAELTWSNGQLSMHDLVGPPRVANKPSVASPPTWEKPRGSGTLESIVNQATRHTGSLKSTVDAVGDSVNELVPWFDPRAAMVKPPTSASNTVTMDALVPCNKRKKGGDEVSMVGCSTRVGSCSGAQNGGGVWVAPVARAANVSEGESATCGDIGGTLFTSTTSLGSPENTSSGNDYTKVSTDDYDSLCHTRSQREAAYNAEGKKKLGINGKSSVSTKRSRAAAIHNQSERKRRDKINQKMKTLQKLVPNSNKTDKASMLDEVIEYLKQLQAQVQMMRGMNMPSMMLPMAMQQQFQMSMMGMAGMGMGMGMGVMDMNTISRAAAASGMPPAAAFMQPQPSWENPGLDRVPPNPASMMQPDPLSAFLACQQSQPMTTFDAYNRMAAMYQQLQQNPGYNGSHK